MMNSVRTEYTPLDIDELSARCLGRVDLVDRVLGRFQKAMGQELERLEEALRAADVTAIANIAHRMKGTSLTVSAPGLTDCAEHLEGAITSESLDEIEESVTAINAEWRRISDLITDSPLRTA